jgi:ATP synthase protein I
MIEKQRREERNFHKDLEAKVAQRASRKLKARGGKDRSVWFGLGMFGLIGWSVAVPTIVSTALGLWIDRHWPGPYSWTLTLLFVGVVLGCVNAWYWLKQQGGPE